ncbi:PPE family protein PPE59, partial [Mycobacterium tuberculosis BTB12-304]
EPPQIYGGGGG